MFGTAALLFLALDRGRQRQGANEKAGPCDKRSVTSYFQKFIVSHTLSLEHYLKIGFVSPYMGRKSSNLWTG